MHFIVIPWLLGGNPTLEIQLLLHGAFCGHINTGKFEEDPAVSWWVFAEKSWHASSLGKGTAVVAEKLANLYKNKRKQTKKRGEAVPL